MRRHRLPTIVDPTVADDPDAGRITFEDALSPRRGAISAGTPSLNEHEPEKPTGTAKVMSFANQKGGVAKTTTTLNLAVALAEMGHRVLCIDLDPQGNLTMSQGIDPDKVEKSMYDVLVHHIPLTEVIQKREIDIAVASIDLAGAEIAMSTQIGRERSLEKAIRGVENDYDFVCIDTPPSLGLLTVNALTASNSVVMPVQCEYLSMRGLMQLQNTLEMIRENLNPKVQVEGHPADDAGLADRPRQGGCGAPGGELRRSRLQVPDPQGDQVRGGTGARSQRPEVRSPVERRGLLPGARQGGFEPWRDVRGQA